jgi:polysaccharide pyruvyl transferase WcaK-like protein
MNKESKQFHKVAIWGSLNKGNFGDDVMNVIFALHLKSLGCTPYVYRLNKKLAQQYGLVSVDNLDDLLDGAIFSIIGGGSWLESRKLGLSYEKDFFEYIEKTNFYNVSYYAISIGGDSNNDKKYLSSDRLKLFSNNLFKGGTVRLKSDLSTLESLGKQAYHFPDIVLLSSEFFGDKKSKNFKSKKYRVAVSQSDSILFLRFIKKIKILSLFYKDIELIFLNTHLQEYNINYEFQLKNETLLLKNKNYESLEDFYNFLSSIDLMISSKLHPGVAALSCGKSFLWIPGLDKTRSFLKSVKLVNFELTLNSALKLILSKKIKKIINSYPFDEIEIQKEKARGHLDFLTSIVKIQSNL